MIPRFFVGALALSAVTAMGAAGLAGIAAASDGPALARSGVAKPYDFNGDGYTDLALGSPYGTVSGHKGAGFVTVVYGASGGPDVTKKKVFSQNTSGVPGTAESGDHFGFALTSFDYDKDGYADLLVGAPDEDTGNGSDAGTETILWGSSSGLTGTGSGAISEPSGYAGAGHRFGYSMAAGDFDADGYTDWVDTAPGHGTFWTLTSRPASAAAASANRAFDPSGQARSVRGKKAGVSAQATNSMDALIPAVGDVDGDGTIDLAIGWQNAAASAPYRYGFDVWTAKSIDTPASEVLTPVTSLAVGDFDGDGYGDVAVGGADESDGVGGHVRVYKGTADAAMSASYRITQATSGVPGTAVAGDHFGYSLAAIDLNKDAKSDLAVGVPYRAISGHSQAGEAIMLYGGASGLSGSGAQAVSQNTSGVAGTAEYGDRFGWQVSVLDVTNDGYGELVAGAPKENSGDGAVSVLKGGATGVTGSGSVSFGASTLGVKGLSAQIGVRIGRLG